MKAHVFQALLLIVLASVNSFADEAKAPPVVKIPPEVMKKYGIGRLADLGRLPEVCGHYGYVSSKRYEATRRSVGYPTDCWLLEYPDELTAMNLFAGNLSNAVQAEPFLRAVAQKTRNIAEGNAFFAKAMSACIRKDAAFFRSAGTTYEAKRGWCDRTIGEFKDGVARILPEVRQSLSLMRRPVMDRQGGKGGPSSPERYVPDSKIQHPFPMEGVKAPEPLNPEERKKAAEIRTLQIEEIRKDFRTGKNEMLKKWLENQGSVSPEAKESYYKRHEDMYIMGKMNEIESLHRTRYLYMVSSLPLVSFLSSANPGNEELASAFDAIARNADKRVETIQAEETSVPEFNPGGSVSGEWAEALRYLDNPAPGLDRVGAPQILKYLDNPAIVRSVIAEHPEYCGVGDRLMQEWMALSKIKSAAKDLGFTVASLGCMASPAVFGVGWAIAGWCMTGTIAGGMAVDLGGLQMAENEALRGASESALPNPFGDVAQVEAIRDQKIQTAAISGVTLVVAQALTPVMGKAFSQVGRGFSWAKDKINPATLGKLMKGAANSSSANKALYGAVLASPLVLQQVSTWDPAELDSEEGIAKMRAALKAAK